ncbi:MAG: tyrosine-type recombinase/integrase [Chloroflexi bacterium]|nr:tyrosine-type recombinase/integrase [Chloroflexota bacterium]
MPSDMQLSTDQPFDQNPAAVYLASLTTANSRRTMHQALNTIAFSLTGEANAFACDWSMLRAQHTIAIRSWLVERYQAATVNKMLAALRGVLKAAWLLGTLPGDDYHKAVAVSSVKNDTLPAGREVASDEIAALLAVCRADETPAGRRDAALIAVLYGAGLRRSEVTQLRRQDYTAAEGKLEVRGKGGKTRIAWLNKQVVTMLEPWLAARGAWSGALFCPINKSGRIHQRHLTTQAVYYILQKRSEEAETQPFSPHDLRRTFVSHLLDAGADIAVVSRMAGHANIQTTARYDRRSEEAKRQAAELLEMRVPDDADDQI